MLRRRPPSTRSICGYVCNSCLSSALVHHGLNGAYNQIRHSSKYVRRRRRRALAKTGVKNDNKDADDDGNGLGDDDEGANVGERVEGNDSTEGGHEKVFTTVRELRIKKPPLKLDIIHALRASLKADEEIPKMEEPKKDIPTTKAKKTTPAPKSKETESETDINSARKTPEQYVEEFEAADEGSAKAKAKKRNKLISKADVEALVALLRSDKMNDEERELAEMFLKVRVPVRKLHGGIEISEGESKPATKVPSTGEGESKPSTKVPSTGEPPKKPSMGFLEQTLNFFGVRKSRSDHRETESSNETIEIPKEKADTPKEKVEPPTEKVEPPTEKVEPPSEKAEPPKKKTEASTKKTGATGIPSEKTQSSKKKTEVPKKEIETPKKKAASTKKIQSSKKKVKVESPKKKTESLPEQIEVAKNPVGLNITRVGTAVKKKAEISRIQAVASEHAIRKAMVADPIQSVNASDLRLVPLEKELAVPVAKLSYGLDRVLFNPGIYNMRDPRSRVFNFDPYLESIMSVKEFDFNALKEYITSSKDKVLISAAKEEKKKYTGSTSSLTSALSHFHFLLSQWRPVNTASLSQSFDSKLKTFSSFQRSPVAVFARWRDGVYAIDADKQFDDSSVLMALGKSMEKLLTLPTEGFERYRRINSDQISEEERNESEPFHYTSMGDFLMRSQLDAHDPRLPGTGMFDLKTRAVVSIRMDVLNYTEGMDYEIKTRHGDFESFEREYYDMIRSAFLKYSLQVRMGRMDGIFVAFHNTQRIFGFQYISLSEMDYALHGTRDTTLGDAEFKLSVDLLNKVLDRAAAKFPEQSLRLHFETRGMETKSAPFMYIFAEPMSEEQIDEIQKTNAAENEEFERRVLGLDKKKIPTEKSIAENPNHSQFVAAVADSETADIDESMMALPDNQLLTEDTLAAAIEADETEDMEVEDDSKGEEHVEEDGSLDEVEESKIIDEADEVEGEEEESEEIEETEEPNEMEEPEVVEESESNEEAAENQNTEIEEAKEAPEEPLKPLENSTEKPADTTSAPDEAGQSLEEYYRALARNFQEGPEKSSTKASEKSDEKRGPLLAMALTVENKVNGEYVERPENLTAGDKWTIDYCFAEVQDPAHAHLLYKRIQARRKACSGFSRDDFITDYIRDLRAMSQKGKEWRAEQDKLDEVEKIKVYGVVDSDPSLKKGDDEK